MVEWLSEIKNIKFDGFFVSFRPFRRCSKEIENNTTDQERRLLLFSMWPEQNVRVVLPWDPLLVIRMRLLVDGERLWTRRNELQSHVRDIESLAYKHINIYKYASASCIIKQLTKHGDRRNDILFGVVS